MIGKELAILFVNKKDVGQVLSVNTEQVCHFVCYTEGVGHIVCKYRRSTCR